MITKYLCDECQELKLRKEIAYRYQINVSGKYPVWEYVCKECAKNEKTKKF
jgi:uncharacterized protein YlaI